jgi:hypothetical protein
VFSRMGVCREPLTSRSANHPRPTKSTRSPAPGADRMEIGHQCQSPSSSSSSASSASSPSPSVSSSPARVLSPELEPPQNDLQASKKMVVYVVGGSSTLRLAAAIKGLEDPLFTDYELIFQESGRYNTVPGQLDLSSTLFIIWPHESLSVASFDTGELLPCADPIHCLGNATEAFLQLGFVSLWHCCQLLAKVIAIKSEKFGRWRITSATHIIFL